MNMTRLPALFYGTVFTVVWALTPGIAKSVSDEQYESISVLGRLNGVALQCRYLGETQRMKQALIETLPKRRELGMAFDQITNDAFLEFFERDETCPEASDFAESVDEAIQMLKQSFPNRDSE